MRYLVFVCVLLCFLESCSSSNEDKRVAETKDITSISEILAIQRSINTIVLDINSSVSSTKTIKKANSKAMCPEIVFASDSGMNISLDFDVSACSESSLSGKIVFNHDFDTGVRTISYQEYCADKICMNGNMSMSFDYSSSDSLLSEFSFSIYTNDFSISNTQGDITTLTIDQKYTYDNDKKGILISGSSSSVEFDGSFIELTIVEDLYIGELCNYISSGILEIKRANESIITINYGDGICDNLAVMTVDGISEEINLDE